MTLRPARLEPTPYARVWGAREHAPWFPETETEVGEFWFPSSGILVKFIFTSQRLSVQVHPDNEQARRLEGPRAVGKTEMWHILRAEPEARIALGFRESITVERLRGAALSGEIEELLDWKPVAAGETYFVRAGAVHAIGAGIVLVEIQQYSDITYRLYDYGRGRELHLEKALQVAHRGPHPGRSTPLELPEGGWRLAACDYFVAESLELAAPLRYRPDAHRCHDLIIVEGAGLIDGAPCAAGQVWRVPAGAGPFDVCPQGTVKFLRTYPPEDPA